MNVDEPTRERMPASPAGSGPAHGPLAGVRVVELAGIGPGPFACMLLADLGADVLRLGRGRPDGVPAELDVLNRGRPSVAIDLKHPGAPELVLRLVEQADVLVEGFRPGVAERLGVGPEDCHAHNPRLVYGRMTGWGQDGPLAPRVGHDINYASITGALHAVGERGRKPVPPLNLVADFGGGALFLVVGVLAALLERRSSGQGQVVDAAMVDGAGTLMAMTHAFSAAGMWRDERGSNLLDGGAPFYDTYRCSDGGYVAVGALEPQFFAALVQTLDAEVGLGSDVPGQYELERWPELRNRIAAAFAQRPRDTWTTVFAEVDACVSPVLALAEAAAHPHIVARGGVVQPGGLPQPAVAPRLSRTPGELSTPPEHPGAGTRRGLLAWGVSETELEHLIASGVVQEF